MSVSSSSSSSSSSCRLRSNYASRNLRLKQVGWHWPHGSIQDTSLELLLASSLTIPQLLFSLFYGHFG